MVVDGADIRIRAGQPFGAGAVGGQGDVQPDIEPVLCRQVKHQVEVVQLVLAGRGLHVVPVAETADDAQPRRPDAGEIIVPHCAFGNRAPVVFDPYRKGGIGMEQELGLGHRYSSAQAVA